MKRLGSFVVVSLNYWKDIVMAAVERRRLISTTTDPSEVETRQLPQPVAAPENEGGAPRRPETGEATSWFVPPLAVPAFLVALIVARVAYQALI